MAHLDLFPNLGSSMTLRAFPCSSCGHRTRLGSSRCGQCGSAKEAYKTGTFLLTSTATVALGVSLAAIALSG